VIPTISIARTSPLALAVDSSVADADKKEDPSTLDFGCAKDALDTAKKVGSCSHDTIRTKFGQVELNEYLAKLRSYFD
jgi:hypothetical protein